MAGVQTQIFISLWTNSYVWEFCLSELSNSKLIYSPVIRKITTTTAWQDISMGDINNLQQNTLGCKLANMQLQEQEEIKPASYP